MEPGRRRSLGRKKRLPPLAMDCRIARFQRLVEIHSGMLSLFADLREKGAGEYILDRQYIEAQLDRAYALGRRILYNMHVILDSEEGIGYRELDRLREASHRIVQDAEAQGSAREAMRGPEADGEGEVEWEQRALLGLYAHLTCPTGGEMPGPAGQLGPPAPGSSLLEWAGWAHGEAADWIVENLTSVTDLPHLWLYNPGKEKICIEISPLGGIRRAGRELRQYLALDPSRRKRVFSFLPLTYLLQGLQPSVGEGGVSSRSCSWEPREKAARDKTFCLQLYLGDAFLLVLLPDFLPLRLFWCSLSAHLPENFLYLFGRSPAPGGGAAFPPPPAFEKKPCRSYRFTGNGTWMFWMSGFSWPQGEERIRLLGHLLSGWIAAASAAGTEPVEEGPAFRRGLQTFLTQIAPCDRILEGEGRWKSL